MSKSVVKMDVSASGVYFGTDYDYDVEYIMEIASQYNSLSVEVGEDNSCNVTYNSYTPTAMSEMLSFIGQFETTATF